MGLEINNRVFMILLIFVCVILGFYMVESGYEDIRSYMVDSNLDSGSEGLQYGVSHLFRDAEGELNQVMKSNEEVYIDNWVTPPFRIETNRYGLREESFKPKDKEDKIRILIIGDSTEFGWSINRSQRYSDVLESKLNNESNSIEFEVINAGTPNYNMDDFFYYLKQRGMDYQPDIVVVGFTLEDAITSDYEDEIKNEIIREISEENKNASDTVKERLFRKRMKERLNAKIEKKKVLDSEIVKYSDKILNLTQTENVSTILFYSLINPPQEHIDNLKRWNKNREANILFAMDALEPPYSNSKYMNSQDDPHPNPRAHKMMGEYIADYLSNSTMAKR